MLMNKIVFVLTLFALFGCQPNIERTNIVEAKTELAVTNPLKIDTTSISKEKGGEFIPPKKTVNIVPDTTINNKFFLKDYKSLSNFYSTNDPLLLVEEIRESPVIIFGNKSNKEYLLAYQYEGDTENAYSCFEIGYFEDDKMLSLERSNQTEETNFQTESGLRLGLSLDEITLIKGKEYEQQESGGYVVINYSIEDYKNSLFLKRYNMPGYFIQIRLKNNAVRKITFGFDYP